MDKLTGCDPSQYTSWKHTGLGKLDKIQLLALFRSRDVRRHERIHESLKVGAPPLGKAVANLPVPSLVALTEAANGSETLIEASLETLNLVVVRAQIVAWELEEGIRNLQHQDVWVVVFMAYQNALAGAAHAILLIVLLQALQPRQHARILLWLSLLDTEGIIRKRIQTDCLWLPGVKRQRVYRRLRALHRLGSDGRHFGNEFVGCRDLVFQSG